MPDSNTPIVIPPPTPEELGVGTYSQVTVTGSPESVTTPSASGSVANAPVTPGGTGPTTTPTNNVSNLPTTSTTGTGQPTGGNGTGTGGSGGTGNPGSTTNLSTPATSATSASPIPGTIKKPIATELIPNPLHKYSSWTYNWSLWWVDTADYNTLVNTETIEDSLNFNLGPYSFVIAEDSGLYPDRRAPTQIGLNYNITKVEIDSLVGLNSKTKATNAINGELTVAEPYGVTFVDSLVQLGFNGAFHTNYLRQPYMLQLDFVGYDDEGKPVPQSATRIYRKRFPVNITGIKIAVTGQGSEYQISFVALNHEYAFSNERKATPVEFTVIAGTVGEFFDPANKNSLTTLYNDYKKREADTRSGRADFADTINFQIDPEIAKAKIIYDKKITINQANPLPTADGIDMNKGSFVIPNNTLISEIINKIIIQSTYIADQLDVAPTNVDIDKKADSLTKLVNVFKVSTKVKYAGASSAGAQTNTAYDFKRNEYATSVTWVINQYPVYDPQHPFAPLFTESRQFITKRYDYIYTGKNVDIINFKINFDTTYYTAFMAYKDQYASNQVTPSTGVETALTKLPFVVLSPQYLVAIGLAQGSTLGELGKVSVTNPARWKSIFQNKPDTIGFNTIGTPNAQIVASMMRSLYSRPSGDMVAIDLDIVGDPTLIKQDDWLYVFDPKVSNDYNNWPVISQSVFAQKYGHIRMDTGQILCRIVINTPLDNDTEWTNQGLVFPRPGTYTSLFSGIYKIIKIKNIFANGVFTQRLSVQRLYNSDYIDASANDAVNTNQNNQNVNTQTGASGSNPNGTTPANAPPPSSTDIAKPASEGGQLPNSGDTNTERIT